MTSTVLPTLTLPDALKQGDVDEISTATIAASLSVTVLVAAATIAVLAYLCCKARNKSVQISSREKLGRLFWLVIVAEVYLVAFAVISIESLANDLSTAIDSNDHLWDVFERDDIIGCPASDASFCCKAVSEMRDSGQFDDCTIPNNCTAADSNAKCCQIAPGTSKEEENYLRWMQFALVVLVLAAFAELMLFAGELCGITCTSSVWVVLFVDGAALLADGTCNLLLLALANKLVSSPGYCFAEQPLQQSYGEQILAYSQMLSDFTNITWVFIILAMLLTTMVLSLRLGFPRRLFGEDEPDDKPQKVVVTSAAPV
eukprot:m.8992 g.8992  ORF g.8992 m.8992 type:complete len:315 (-) comp9339_c0_seq1:29-973(-)